MKIIKKEILMDEDLKQKLEIICSFANTKPTFINGSIRSIEKTNLNYIEPHRVIIKGITFLAFNYDKYIYIKNIRKKSPVIKVSKNLSKFSIITTFL